MEFPVALTSLLAVLVCSVMLGQAQPYRRNYVPAPIGHDGRVIDTPEVAQAKAAHLAAFSKLAVQPSAYYHGAPEPHYTAAAAAPAAYGPHGAYSNPGYFSSRIQHGPYGYHGPPAPLAHDGRVVDTPEVAQAKAAHFAAFNHAASHAAYNAPAPGAYNHQSEEYDTGAYHGDTDDDGSNEGHYEGHASAPYQGPPAPLAQDGRVVDTPEVAQAKAAHLAAFHRASHGHHTPHPAAGYYADY